jgi:hypothetical protein
MSEHISLNDEREAFLTNKTTKLQAEIDFQLALMKADGVVMDAQKGEEQNDSMYNWAQSKAPFFRKIIDERPDLLYAFYQQFEHASGDNQTAANAIVTEMQKMIEELQKKFSEKSS